MSANQNGTPDQNSLLKVLLVEGIHPTAKERFEAEGYQVDTMEGPLSPEQLKRIIAAYHLLGIRSKTRLTADSLCAATHLMAVGTFCIGTDHIDLEAAKNQSIAVFNAPLGNSRSVAEATLAHIIVLARRIIQRNKEMHEGIWNRTHAGSFEVQGKTLGIIGYGNIGSQVSPLAEALGMNVIFYDILPKTPLGHAKVASSADEVLRTADFVTLHVPATALTKNMISQRELQMMKNGSYLINTSRGSVVDVAALAQTLKNGHLAGAAIDVFPNEPERNTNVFKTELQGQENVILTPHVAGATEEAQSKIAQEVSSALIRFVKNNRT